MSISFYYLVICCLFAHIFVTADTTNHHSPWGESGSQARRGVGRRLGQSSPYKTLPGRYRVRPSRSPQRIFDKREGVVSLWLRPAAALVNAQPSSYIGWNVVLRLERAWRTISDNAVERNLFRFSLISPDGPSVTRNKFRSTRHARTAKSPAHQATASLTSATSFDPKRYLNNSMSSRYSDATNSSVSAS